MTAQRQQVNQQQLLMLNAYRARQMEAHMARRRIEGWIALAFIAFCVLMAIASQ